MYTLWISLRSRTILAHAIRFKPRSNGDVHLSRCAVTVRVYRRVVLSDSAITQSESRHRMTHTCSIHAPSMHATCKIRCKLPPSCVAYTCQCSCSCKPARAATAQRTRVPLCRTRVAGSGDALPVSVTLTRRGMVRRRGVGGTRPYAHPNATSGCPVSS